MTTYLIIAFTIFVSYQGFKSDDFFRRYMFNAFLIYQNKDYKRLITHGFLHADWTHLIFNMFTLFFFGDYVEDTFIALYGRIGSVIYLLFYLSAIPLASLISLIKYRNMHYYNSVGASGAVSAILFAAILFFPDMRIMMLLLPIPIPGYIFAIVFLAYSHYMSKQNHDNVNHDAHFVGSVYGLIFPILLHFQFATDFFAHFLG
jgi:membrane associated rhomboid family serine protease